MEGNCSWRAELMELRRRIINGHPKCTFSNRIMKSTLGYQQLVPVIKIDQSIVSDITQAVRSHDPEDGSVGLLIGSLDWSSRKPVLTFTKFRLVDLENDQMTLVPNEIQVFGLFEPTGEIDWSDLTNNYIITNSDTKRYSSNYYFYGICTFSYTDALNIVFYLATPEVVVQVTRLKEVSSHTKDQGLSYATYERPQVTDKLVKTEFKGVTDERDPKIVALCYSISLAHDNKPIRALIGNKVCNIETQMGSVYFYEGQARVSRGGATIHLKNGDDTKPDEPEEIEEQSAPIHVSNDKDIQVLLEKIESMSAQIASLEAKVTQQSEAFEAALREKQEATEEMFNEILQAIKKNQHSATDVRKIPRFVAPHQVSTPARRKLSIEHAGFWEKGDEERSTSFLAAAVATPVSDVSKRLAHNPTPKNPAAGRSPSYDVPPSIRKESQRKKPSIDVKPEPPKRYQDPELSALDLQAQKDAELVQKASAKIDPVSLLRGNNDSLRLPSSIDKSRDKPGMTSHAPVEQSFFVEDYSVDTKELMKKLGLA